MPHVLWRIERSGAASREPGTRSAFAHAVTLGRNDAILFMNAAARDLVGERARTGRPDLPGPAGAVRAGEISARDRGRRLPHVELEALGRAARALPAAGRGGRGTRGWLGLLRRVAGAAAEARPSGRSSSPTVRRVNFWALRPVTAACWGLFEGLGRPISDWLDGGGRGPRRAPVRVPQGAPRQDQRGLRAGDAQPDRRGWRDVLIAVLNDATEFKSLEAAVRPEPENAGHRTARRRRGA